MLVQDLVQQFEAERVLAEYARIEAESGMRFRFFDLDRAILHFQELIKEGLGTEDLLDRLDDKAKSICYYAIRIHLEKLGCLITDFSLEDCVKAKNVGDIVEAVWGVLKR